MGQHKKTGYRYSATKKTFVVQKEHTLRVEFGTFQAAVQVLRLLGKRKTGS